MKCLENYACCVVEQSEESAVGQWAPYTEQLERQKRDRYAFSASLTILLLCLSLVWLFLSGCGSGGYPGTGIASLTATTLKIDAGQSISVGANISANVPVTWTLSGATCSGAACGTLSSNTGATVLYMAPTPLTAPLQVMLVASVNGTQNTRTVTINVAPPPSIPGTAPFGTVGTPYSFTYVTVDGMAPTKLSLQSGTFPAGLTFNAATGTVSGTPTTAGTSSFVLQAVDSSDIPFTVTANKTITIQASTGTGTTLTVSGNPPAGTVGSTYSATLQATGGTAPYTWSVTAGTLPAGLTLNAVTGAITGTPTAAGTSTFTASATDSAGGTAAGTFTVTIAGNGSTGSGLTLTTGTLPGGTVGTPYTGTIGVTGGTAPYQCTVTSGTLPAGLTLGANCTVTGTPANAGTSTVGITVTDSGNPAKTGTGQVSLTFAPAAVTISTGTLPSGTVNTPYSGTISVAGGTGPYTCALAGGTLPAGLSLNANCTVTGTPTTAGTQTITVRGTDSANPAQSGTGAVSLTINPTALTLSTAALPNGTVGSPYTGTIGVTGGTAPYTCALASGTLPAGLALNANCSVTGTPTVAGTSSVSVSATDSSNPARSVTAPESITINAAPALTLGTPAAATVNQPYTGAVPVSGGSAPYTCTVTGGTLPAGLTLGTNCAITGTPTTAGTATATVTATDSSAPARTTTGAVTVTVNAAPVTLGVGNPATATVGMPYTGTIPVSGGTAPYSCSIASGTLPAGLALGVNCAVTGTPTTAGTTVVQVTATDSANPAHTVTAASNLTVNPAAVTLTVGNPATGTVGTPYTSTIPVSGGTAPYTCTVASGTLPAGLALGANCAVTGTPTAAGTSAVQVTATDSANPAHTTTAPATITINPAAVTLAIGNPATATAGTPYTGTIPVSGGTAPYTCTITSGTLPAGLTLGANCAVTGTPTTAGTSTVQVSVTDSANPVHTTTAPSTITVNPAAVTLAVGNPATATVGTPYTGTIPISGGTAPYTCSIASGTLPAGLALGANCAVTGTPTTAGTATVEVTATDSANPAHSTTAPSTITVNPAAVTLAVGNPATATVGTAYAGTIPVSNGTAPYTCTIASGTLPAGLALGANCAVTGTPTTAGTTTVQVTATDSANPAHSTTAPSTLTVNPAPVTLTVGNPATATVGTAYTGTIPVTGGTAPYTCTLASGTLPAGLALGANCAVTGTPTTAGTVTVQVSATDASNPAHTTTAPSTLTVNPAAVTLAVGNPATATVGTAYTGTIPVSGGTAPYTCTIATGTLPAGLALGANCAVTGTPTAAGTVTVQVTATDAANPAHTVTAPSTITVDPAPVTLTVGNPATATVGTPYTGTIPVTGGTAPYTCTLASGTLPAGLTLGANCAVTGTPTTAGTTTVQVTATDAANPAHTTTAAATLTVDPAPTPLVVGNPPTATVATPYTGTIPVTGGTAPYTCTIASGTLPAGLALGANCTVSGTPTTAGTSTVQVTATDSANPAKTITGPAVITVQPVPALTLTGSLPNAVVNQPYTQTLQATGGVAPYTYAVTAGALPAGINLATDGVISGTPTAPGAASFTVTATDSEGTPQTANLPLVLLVTYEPTAEDALLKGPYAFLFQGYDDVAVGVLAYKTATAGSITADGNGAITAGEEDSNHQTSNPTGNTIATANVLGTYTVGTDRRGSLTLTRLNANGTVERTTTYAIALDAAVAPATNAAQGSLIEFDGNQAAGTKGSGTLLAQTAAAFPTGLNGSYAFGVSGDTPCLPTCTIGIQAGPVASVGEFTAANNTITGGTGDTNIGSNNFASSALSGTLGTADTNGRIQMSLLSSKLAGIPFPTDYAAYVVDANRAIIVSTDKHSAYILQAGTATRQTLATFSDASLNAPFVGYENSPVNPGLLNTTLQNTLNLSTATVFRGTGNGAGTCDTTNVDSSGTTGVVNGLGGIVSAPVVNALLGSYQALGNSSCAVTANGRAVFNYPASDAAVQATLQGAGLPTSPSPRVVYLSAANQGYFLETGYAGLGRIEAQTGAPYSNASLNGTYVFASVPASTLASANNSGVFTANGAGQTSSTVDRNVGVGTINVLELGTTNTATYNITDTAAGRFFLSTGEVIYEIGPGRFALLEPQVANTSAYVALLF